MSVSAWRVVPAEFAGPPFDPFSGDGARLHGGRWNSPGIPVVYTSDSLALAVLETLVHAGSLAAVAGRVAFPVVIPPELIVGLQSDDLPADWHDPAAPDRLKALGDAWVAAATTPVLRVPSAVIPVEFNDVLNPRHPAFRQIAVGPPRPLPIDPRLLKS